MSEPSPDPTLSLFGVTIEFLEEREAWIRRDTGSPGVIDVFFQLAGKLMLLLKNDCLLAGPMFVHAVIGLEAMLRVQYGTHIFEPEKKESFRHLLERAEKEGRITDQTFSNPCSLKGFEKRFNASSETRLKLRNASYAQKFCVLIPMLRNAYFHGKFLYWPELVSLTIQVREAADMLVMPRTPDWKKKLTAGPAL